MPVFLSEQNLPQFAHKTLRFDRFQMKRSGSQFAERRFQDLHSGVAQDDDAGNLVGFDLTEQPKNLAG